MDALRERLLPPMVLAVIGLSAFVIGAAGLSAVHLNASLEQMERNAAESSAALSRSINKVLVTNIEHLLARSRDADLAGLRDDTEISQIRRTIGRAMADRLVLLPRITEVAVIAPGGRTVFATGGTQIGADRSGAEGFRIAMTGEASPNIIIQDPVNGTDTAQASRDIVLNYFPIPAAHPATNSTLGVIEIRTDVTTRKSQIHRTLLLELGIMLASFAVIFALLLAIVRVSNLRLIDNYRQQKRLYHNVQRAEESDAAKSVFLADISHELRTPLNAIIGFSEILLDETFGPLGSQRYKSYVEDIHSSGRSLLAIISDLLDLTRIQSGQAELQEEAMSLSDCLKDTADMLSCQPEAMDLEFHFNLDPDLPELLADRRAVQHIVQDLLSNAIKYTLEGSITVAARLRQDQTIEFSVADTGIGIPDDELHRLAQRFRQIEVSWKRKFEGTGLGLALVKALMNQHGGDVSIDSEVGVGTTITCHFPRSRTVGSYQEANHAA